MSQLLSPLLVIAMVDCTGKIQLIVTECHFGHAFAHFSTFHLKTFNDTTTAHSACEQAQPGNVGKLTSPG